MNNPLSHAFPSNSQPGSGDVAVVSLACIQCRKRHVKCDSAQPVCGRCSREGKECIYQKSRRGGLDKAALARRRLRLQQEEVKRRSQGIEHDFEQLLETTSPASKEHDHHASSSNPSISSIPNTVPSSGTLSFDSDRLLRVYYENFYPTFPITLPLHYLIHRLQGTYHGMDLVLIAMHFVGSLYAPSMPSELYYRIASEAFCSTNLPKTGFSVQAMMIFAIAQHHSNLKLEARRTLDMAISIGLELRINSKEFAYEHGEGDPVLEESWRRTYYFLYMADQHFAISATNPLFTMIHVENEVDLPCDDEFYETGQIPRPITWKEYEQREFAAVEVVYSSIVYLYDVGRIVAYMIRTFMQTGSFTDTVISNVDVKIAIWQSLLPACKKDPLRKDGRVDEVMFLAHLSTTIILMNSHRPFSSLTYSMEEASTKSFVSPVPFFGSVDRSRNADHTKRALIASDMHAKFVSIPCKLALHHPFTLAITASIAAAQISACNIIFDEQTRLIARDRVRLSIGYLSQMGTVWPLAREMAKEVRQIARQTLSGTGHDSF